MYALLFFFCLTGQSGPSACGHVANNNNNNNNNNIPSIIGKIDSIDVALCLKFTLKMNFHVIELACSI